ENPTASAPSAIARPARTRHAEGGSGGRLRGLESCTRRRSIRRIGKTQEEVAQHAPRLLRAAQLPQRLGLAPESLGNELSVRAVPQVAMKMLEARGIRPAAELDHRKRNVRRARLGCSGIAMLQRRVE